MENLNTTEQYYQRVLSLFVECRVVVETLFEDLSPLLDAWGLAAATP